MNYCPTESFYIVFHYLFMSALLKFLFFIVRLGKKCAGGCILGEGDGGALHLSTGESPVGDPIYLRPRGSESFYIGFLRTLYSSHIVKIFDIPVSILYTFKLFSHSIPKFIFLCSLNRIYFQSSGRKCPQGSLCELHCCFYILLSTSYAVYDIQYIQYIICCICSVTGCNYS